jgi:beta-galactosidase
MIPMGAVYKVYREHARADIEATLRAMRDLGLTHVVVWPAVYWWEDRGLAGYPYDTGRFILDTAGRLGLRVIMETAGQLANLEYAPDDRLRDEHFAVTAEGRPTPDNGHWYYAYLNWFHPGVQALVDEHLAGVARAYKDHPALYGWDVWNETMFESYDPYTAEAFRGWLRKKYGSLDRLNDAWDRTFTDWAQVRPSRLLWASVMPFVDYKQFHKDAVAMIAARWASRMRALDPGHPVIADNIHSALTDDGNWYERAQDDRAVARTVDEFGISLYPKNSSPAMEPHKRCLTLDAVRAAAGPFWVSEMQTHHQSIFNPASGVAAHELAWWTLEAIAHGARGVVYWKWGAFQKGLQTFGRGLVDGAGPTPRSAAVKDLCAVLASNATILEGYAPRPPRAAILYDRLAHDFTKAFTIPYAPRLSTTIYTDSLEGLYRCLWDANVPARIAYPDEVAAGRLEGCRALFVTGQLNLSPELAAGLERFAARGGLVVCDGKFGEIGDDGLLHHRPPGGLADRLGFRVGDMSADIPPLEVDGDGLRALLEGVQERREVEVSGSPARVVGRFADGATGAVASRVGEGEFLYLATHAWLACRPGTRAGAADLVASLAARHDLAPCACPCPDVRVALGESRAGTLAFAFNYGERRQEGPLELRGMAPGRWRVTALGVAGAAPVATVAVGADGRLAFALVLAPRGTAVYVATRDA